MKANQSRKLIKQINDWSEQLCWLHTRRKLELLKYPTLWLFVSASCPFAQYKTRHLQLSDFAPVPCYPQWVSLSICNGAKSVLPPIESLWVYSFLCHLFLDIMCKNGVIYTTGSTWCIAMLPDDWATVLLLLIHRFWLHFPYYITSDLNIIFLTHDHHVLTITFT